MENEIKKIFDKVLKTDVPMEWAKLAIELHKLKKKDEKLFVETMNTLLSKNKMKRDKKTGEIVLKRLRPITMELNHEWRKGEAEEINKNPELVKAREYFFNVKNNEVN